MNLIAAAGVAMRTLRVDEVDCCEFLAASGWVVIPPEGDAPLDLAYLYDPDPCIRLENLGYVVREPLDGEQPRYAVRADRRFTMPSWATR